MISFSSFLPKQWKWDYLTVLFTLLLITYIPITSQYWIFYHAYPPFHHLGYFLLHLFFDFCILNLYINYFLAMFTHPGRVPAEWVPRWITDTNPSGELIEVKKSIQKPRFCRTCNQYKPPRSHHCRQCQHGILLHGPPGCGKTSLASAIANELGVPFISVSGPSLVSGMSGESEKLIRDIFSQAIAVAPSLIFIDEIDSITPKREFVQREMERRMVAQFLTCMD
ncbi:hypothetical protein HMI54_010808, partial [Coelomomyces lativittatus]